MVFDTSPKQLDQLFHIKRNYKMNVSENNLRPCMLYTFKKAVQLNILLETLVECTLKKSG